MSNNAEYRLMYDAGLLEAPKVVIWCRGLSALDAYVELRSYGVNVVGFTDSFVLRHGERYAGLPLIPYSEVLAMTNTAICVTSGDHRIINDIARLISETGCAPSVYVKHMPYLPTVAASTAATEYWERVRRMMADDEEVIAAVRDSLADADSVRAYDALLRFRASDGTDSLDAVIDSSHPMYFPPIEIMPREDGEIFVDCGTYDGSTSIRFAQWNPQYSKIYIMEPEPIMFAIMKEYVELRKLRGAIMANKGAYSRMGVINFRSQGEGSSISEDGAVSVDVTTIDEMLNGDRATFIKMDIEGAELEVLEVAPNVKTQKLKKYVR